MISVEQALAVRRLLLVVAALAATLAAHAVAARGLALVPTAPLTWGWLASLAVFAGRRRGAVWRALSAPGILGRLVGLQLALHCAMTAAPWAFGLAVHHRPALVTPLALAAHAVAALILTALLTGAERLLSIAQRVARAVRAAFRPPAASGRHRPATPLPAHRIPRGSRRRPDRARGPPPLAA